MSIERLADHVLAVADQEGERITNLQLHKILFFSIGMAIRNKVDQVDILKENFDKVFERWRYGPVVPSLYHRYNHYGYRKIEDEGHYQEDYDFLNEIITSLLSVDVYRMVSLSHQMEAWDEYEDDILERLPVPKYTIEEIERDFLNA